jgi:hypothetical protein
LPRDRLRFRCGGRTKRASAPVFVTYAFVSRANFLRTNYAELFEITTMYPILPVESAVALEALAAFFTVVTSLFGWFFLARV